MKKLKCFAVILLLAATVSWAGTQQGRSWYVGINPLAVPAAFQLEENTKRYIPMASGNEYGLALSSGCFIMPNMALEGRLSYGHSNQFAAIGQIHAGANYFFNHKSNGFYAGGYVKFWDYYNRLTKVHFMNIAPYAALGYWIDVCPVFIDLRLNQTIAVMSWSTLEHTSAAADWFFSPWPAFMPVMPSLTVTIGWQIK